jgi:pimeloyl-ACP methyl ester carboxylesterase
MNLVLIHGMGRTPISMLLLCHRLQKLRHKVYLFGYSPTFESLESVTTRLSHFIHCKIGSLPYALVGHSLGTVIIRNALRRLDQHLPTACFLIAPPMIACRAAKFFSRFWLYQIFTGEMGKLLAQEDFMQQLPFPENTKIYAGVSGLRGSWLPFGHELNDCILSISEATKNVKATVVKVPSIHTFMMNSKVVFNDIASSLKSIS